MWEPSVTHTGGTINGCCKYWTIGLYPVSFPWHQNFLVIHFFVSTKPSIASKVAMVTIMEVILWLLAVSRVSQEHSKLLHLQDGFTALMIACRERLTVISSEVILRAKLPMKEATKREGGNWPLDDTFSEFSHVSMLESDLAMHIQNPSLLQSCWWSWWFHSN